MDELPEVTAVERLALRPGDALVIRFPGQVSRQAAEDVEARVRATLKLDESIPVLILAVGARAEVIGKASDEGRIRDAMAEAEAHPGRIVTR